MQPDGSWLDAKAPRTAHARHAALRELGVKRFVLGIHASAFPAGAWDAGHGAPLSAAGERVLAFAAELGFDALGLGPLGQVSVANVSPYDATVFARSTWTLGIEALTSEEHGALLLPQDAASLELGVSQERRVEPLRVARITQRAIELCFERFEALRARVPQHPFVRGFGAFREEHAAWLEHDALYEALAARAGDDPRAFDPGLRSLFEPGPAGVARRAAVRATLSRAIEQRELAQYLAHLQHAAFRRRAHQHGVALWGDMQVGYSVRDTFLRGEAFAPGWHVGAPPSRTNPDGQPWGYPLLHPSQLAQPGSAARELFARRVRKLLREHDGLRIDHPHGLVCPWIYEADAVDPQSAVRRGTRAYESPLHPCAEVRSWAIARAEDLNPNAHAPYADDHVLQLDAAQVERYAVLFDALLDTCREHGLGPDAIATEVLSTCPYPLARVLERHRLGRFRVTQKANLDDPLDPYRSDRAGAHDWMMLGTHDTPPCFALARSWLRDGYAHKLAAYLAQRLVRDPARRSAMAARFIASEGDLLRACLADLFISGADNVYVFVGDLLGETAPFNRAGLVHEDNWTARLPANFEQRYAARARSGEALDVDGALALALAARS